MSTKEQGTSGEIKGIEFSGCPETYRDESFFLLKKGVFDDPEVNVYVSGNEEIAILDPRPTMDYSQYQPRHRRLKLTGYRQKQNVIEARLEKVGRFFEHSKSVLEIGASDGAFLSALRDRYPGIALHAVEPDAITKEAREAVGGIAGFDSLDEAIEAGVQIDTICAFHVFEHILEPDAWVRQLKQLFLSGNGSGGRLILEVPSLTDPLRALYRIDAFTDFYFQRQHPFVYSEASLNRILSHHGFAVETVASQRYGLSNHLAWLANGKPGGSPELERIFGNLDSDYRAALESERITDTAIAIADLKPN